MQHRHTLLAAALASSLCALSSSSAHAESGRFNLHVDLGASSAVFGNRGPSNNGGMLGFGPTGILGFDWQISAPIALELIAGGGYIPPTLANFGAGLPYVTAAAGARFRFLDNREGYANEPGGDYQGNFWASAHVGYHLFDSSHLGFDLGVGYEFSVIKPLQLGVFARGALLVLGSANPVDVLMTVGINASIEFGSAPAVDTDHDGLSDERESQRWHSDPTNPDTDGDGLNDGLEARTNTNPINRDTDSDTLADGVEDANHNGTVDGTESDPRDRDTDHGGVSDGWEAAHPGHNPRDPADDDDDHDGVNNEVDQCAGTPRGTEVDARGCAVLRAELVLDGINFETNSAVINDSSAPTLERAAQILRDNPTVRVEIGGHTDDVGSAPANQRLSTERANSVLEWLTAHQIPRSQMTARGYGMTRPVVPNTDDASRARNRRIQFRRLDR